MPMASEACAVLLGSVGPGLGCLKMPRDRPLFASSHRFLSISCKMRQRNLGSQHRRQKSKRFPPKSSTVNMKSQSNDDEDNGTQDASGGHQLNSDSHTLSSTNGDSNSIAMTVKTLPSANDGVIQIEKVHGRQLPGVSLEDLIAMIRNAEKNILLLNAARVQALEDLDKILSEKEALQAEINNLEMKLAETDARIKVAAKEKIHVELLENQLEKLKNEMASNRFLGEKHDLHDNEGKLNLDSVTLDAKDSPLAQDLSSLREENMLLKDDIQNLKVKLDDVKETEQRVLMLEKERSILEISLKELESKLAIAQEDVSKLSSVKSDCKTLSEKVESLQGLLDQATKQAEQAVTVLHQNHELQRKVDLLEASLQEATADKFSSEKALKYNELLEQKVKLLEERLQTSDEEINSHIHMYQESVKEFQDIVDKLKEEIKNKSLEETMDDMPSEFWSRLLLTIDGLLLEKKISLNDASSLREMAWKKDNLIRDAYLACKGKVDNENLSSFLKLALSGPSSGLNIIHIAAEMAPVAKVGGLGDVVSGLGKALQRKGHLVEIILPKYDCVQYDRICDLKVLDVVLQSYFDGQLFKNQIWVGTVEGLPVYFIEPHHPAKFFWRGQFYGEHDDFKRFSYFSRAALELLYQSGKKPNIIHCHDWHTAFVAPLYWDIYATKGFNSARICFTCHNFEYQGVTSASELASCGLDVHHLHRPDRMQDNSAHDKVNPIKGAVVYSNIVTTVSPTYAQEVRTTEGGRGLQETLNFHSRKFVGILNGIDTDAWNPFTDTFLKVQYNPDNLQGKIQNKKALRKDLNLSTSEAFRPLVGCITRLVPQKGVHLIRHAIYRTLELGGQFVLLGSSPVPHIQREFEGIANHFQSDPHVRLLLKFDEALSHTIYAATDMLIIPSLFEPCGLTQMIAMRYGSVPIVRSTGGLNDSVFDIDDDSVPLQFRNGFKFARPDEQGLSEAMERAFNYYFRSPESWQQLAQKVMRMDFGWDTSAAQYEELYEKAVARARASKNL
ncbi:putative starch synthase [Dioscorea sansibarensis]